MCYHNTRDIQSMLQCYKLSILTPICLFNHSKGRSVKKTFSSLLLHYSNNVLQLLQCNYIVITDPKHLVMKFKHNL